jgi:hypothetical protein
MLALQEIPAARSSEDEQYGGGDPPPGRAEDCQPGDTDRAESEHGKKLAVSLVGRSTNGIVAVCLT